MRHILICLLPALAPLGALAAESSTAASDSINIVFTDEAMAPRIVIKADDGSFPAPAEIDDSNSIRMTATPDGYLAENVTISNGGFLFYAPLPSDSLPQEEWQKVYYNLPFWAERPVLIRYLNPLYRVFSTVAPSDNYIDIEDGTYSIHYFTRKQQESVADQFYELFSIVDADDPTPDDQPRELFLVNMYNEAIPVPESSTGIYQAQVTLPDDYFKVCYQSAGYYIPAFAFGPASPEESVLEGGRPCALTYGMNTYQAFTYSTAAASPDTRLKAGEDAYVTITLDGERSSLLINPVNEGPVTAIAGVDASASASRPLYFTPAGLAVDSPSVPGLYILRQGSDVRKILVR